MNDTDDSWRRYAHADATQRYTRNLIATDHESFVLMALVWNANCESAIHDHPCDGCWWKVLQGTVQECRYKYNDNVDDEQHTVDETSDPTNNPLICYQDCTYQQGDVAFMDNTLGLHKVGNPSHDQPAVTLHLYAPPFPRCRVFSANDARVHHTATVTFYSKYGVVVNNK
jgi:cysteine dioxygenase